jgi:hypothetical protein
VLLIRSYSALTNTRQPARRPAGAGSYPAEYTNRAKGTLESIYQRLAAVPGVEMVGSADGIPFSG